MRWLARTFAVAAFSAAPGVVAAQGPARASTSPAGIARAFLDAVTKSQWIDAARFLDLEPIEGLRRESMRSLRQPQQRMPAMTAEDFMRADPEMPRAVAEYQAERSNRRRLETPPDDNFYPFARISDTLTFVQLTPLYLAAHWVEGQDMRYQMRRGLELNGGCDRASIDSLIKAMAPKFTVLGAVERSDTAYVLFRDDLLADAEDELAPVGGPNVLPLIRRKGTWLVRPRFNLLQGGSFGFGGCDSTTRRPPR